MDNKIQILVVCVILMLSGCTGNQEPLVIEPILASQGAMYPQMEVQDWYKLMHQASMGNRHLGVEDSLIYAYLVDEWGRIEPSTKEPLIEFISPDSSMVRLNLRPFKASGGTTEAVFEAMQHTWDQSQPSEKQLLNSLGELQHAVRRNRLDIPEARLDHFIKQQKELGFPAVHHSERYEAAYQPAYRVLERRFIP